MSPREEAAQAAREQGRQVSSYVVEERGLVRNGRTLKAGARIRLSQADADVFLAAGRIRRPAAKAKSAGSGAAE